jgi:hypothetical protein
MNSEMENVGKFGRKLRTSPLAMLRLTCFLAIQVET